MKKLMIIAFLLTAAILLPSCGGLSRYDSKYIYVFDFDLDKKETNQSAEVTKGQTAYTVTDKKGNVFDMIYEGEEVVSECIKDKDGKVLYTMDTQKHQIDENNSYNYTTICAYYYENDLLVKEISYYCSSNVDSANQLELSESQSDSASSGGGNFFENIFNEIALWFGGEKVTAVEQQTVVAPGSGIGGITQSNNGDSDVSVVQISPDAFTIPYSTSIKSYYTYLYNDAFDDNYTEIYIGEEKEETEGISYVEIPYIDRTFIWQLDFGPSISAIKIGNSYAQYETDYEYKDGVRYISKITYETDGNSKGTGTFTYNGDGTCKLEYLSNHFYNYGMVNLTGYTVSVSQIIYKDNKTRRGLIPTELEEESLYKNFEKKFKCETKDGICTVTDETLEKKTYQQTNYYTVEKYKNNVVTEMATYDNKDELICIDIYEYDDDRIVKATTYNDINKTDKFKETLITYDIEYKELAAKKQKTEYENGAAVKVSDKEYRIVKEDDTVRSELCLFTEVDANGALLYKLVNNEDGSSDGRTYDADGTLTKKYVITSDGSRSEYKYDGSGYTHTETDKNGEVVTEEYVEGNIPNEN